MGKPGGLACLLVSRYEQTPHGQGLVAGMKMAFEVGGITSAPVKAVFSTLPSLLKIAKSVSPFASTPNAYALLVWGSVATATGLEDAKPGLIEVRLPLWMRFTVLSPGSATHAVTPPG